MTDTFFKTVHFSLKCKVEHLIVWKCCYCQIFLFKIPDLSGNKRAYLGSLLGRVLPEVFSSYGPTGTQTKKLKYLSWLSITICTYYRVLCYINRMGMENTDVLGKVYKLLHSLGWSMVLWILSTKTWKKRFS